jgi:hypothetical protein
MIVDEANIDIELENDPFIEAGIDVPANLPYKHDSYQEQSYKKVLGEKGTPELTRKLRKINQWSLRGTGVSTSVLCNAFEEETSDCSASDIEEGSDELLYRRSQRSGRRLSSPALYGAARNEIEKTQKAEKRIKKRPVLRSSTSYNLFQSSYVHGPHTPPDSTSSSIPCTAPVTSNRRINFPHKNNTLVRITTYLYVCYVKQRW